MCFTTLGCCHTAGPWDMYWQLGDPANAGAGNKYTGVFNLAATVHEHSVATNSNAASAGQWFIPPNSPNISTNGPRFVTEGGAGGVALAIEDRTIYVNENWTGSIIDQGTYLVWYDVIGKSEVASFKIPNFSTDFPTPLSLGTGGCNATQYATLNLLGNISADGSLGVVLNGPLGMADTPSLTGPASQTTGCFLFDRTSITKYSNLATAKIFSDSSQIIYGPYPEVISRRGGRKCAGIRFGNQGSKVVREFIVGDFGVANGALTISGSVVKDSSFDLGFVPFGGHLHFGTKPAINAAWISFDSNGANWAGVLVYGDLFLMADGSSISDVGETSYGSATELWINGALALQYFGNDKHGSWADPHVCHEAGFVAVPMIDYSVPPSPTNTSGTIRDPTRPWILQMYQGLSPIWKIGPFRHAPACQCSSDRCLYVTVDWSDVATVSSGFAHDYYPSFPNGLSVPVDDGTVTIPGASSLVPSADPVHNTYDATDTEKIPSGQPLAGQVRLKAGRHCAFRVSYDGKVIAPTGVLTTQSNKRIGTYPVTNPPFIVPATTRGAAGDGTNFATASQREVIRRCADIDVAWDGVEQPT